MKRALVVLLTLIYSPILAQNPFPFVKYRERVRAIFQHAYEGYLTYAYPLDELRPLSCDGHDTWGSFSLTLVDALDTLVVMGNYTEFRRATELLLRNLDSNKDVNVSVFETNIRVVGGLLSAHLLSRRAQLPLVEGWPCDGPLLRQAEIFASKLLPAFDTPTGMPYGTVNLRHGVPEGETTVTCTAGVATFIVEFGALSRLTGDPRYEKAALRALKAMWQHRSAMGLVGNHIDISTGRWTAVDSGIGAGVDSYFEYLVKGAMLFQLPELHAMFQEYKRTIEEHIKHDDWHFWVNMERGSVTMPVFQSLEAFWPGVLTLHGDVDDAIKTLHNYHQVWKQFGFLPESYNVPKALPIHKRASYPLRPELIESILYLYRAVRDPTLLDMGVDILNSIESAAKTKCGYATIENVETHSLEDRMESFFLSETTKYLYLLFDPDNFLHSPAQDYVLHQVPGHTSPCVLEAGGYVFNTEAHPLDPAALYCCSAERNLDEEDVRKTWARAVKALDDKPLPKENLSSDERSVNASSSGGRFEPRYRNKKSTSSPTMYLYKHLSLLNDSFSHLLTCRAEPFHRPFSIYGQMFDEGFTTLL